MLIFFLITLMVPATVTTVSTYLLLEKIGLATNVLGVILPMCCSAMNIMLFKGFFDAVPNEMLEAAKIDGAAGLSGAPVDLL